MIEWLDFYRPYFTESSDLEQFVQVCESLEVHDPRHRAKIMMHQGRRLLSVADGMEIVKPGYEPLKLLFLLICAENISKLNVSTEELGQSRYHVRRFFVSSVLQVINKQYSKTSKYVRKILASKT
jgi:hypothetical protein